MGAVASPAPVPETETEISRQVVAAIGAHAAAATPGVIRLEASVSELLAGVGRSARHWIGGITPAPVTGTAATVTDGQARLRVEVAVSGGQRAADVAAAVRRSVTRAVTSATGLPVAAVSVAILDIDLNDMSLNSMSQSSMSQSSMSLNDMGPDSLSLDSGPRDPALRRDAEPRDCGAAGAGGAETGDIPQPPGESRAGVCAAVVRAVRSVPGLQPASPALPQRARWMRWDPAILAVSLTDSHLEVQLAATRLPLPPLLEQAAAAIRQATAPTRWAALPHRLVVTALDATALDATVLDATALTETGRDE
jgi:uncharacterized alkaline shock family protein YloU